MRGRLAAFANMGFSLSVPRDVQRSSLKISSPQNGRAHTQWINASRTHSLLDFPDAKLIVRWRRLRWGCSVQTS